MRGPQVMMLLLVADSLEPTLIGLPEFRLHCRAERVEDLIDDLEMLVEDVQAARVAPSTALSVIRGGR